MKILIIITKGDSGGAQMSVLNLACELKRRGHDVAVGLGEGNFLPDELNKEKVAYHRFRHLKRSYNPLEIVFFIFEIRKFLRKNNYEIVHFNSSNSLPGALGAKLFDRRTKTVFTFRGMSMLDDHHQMLPVLKKIYLLYFKFFLQFIDRPVFVSRENLTRSAILGLSAGGNIVYNGLDPNKLEFYPREEARKLLKQFHVGLEGKYVIGSIGRLIYAKNYEFLIEVFDEVLLVRPEAVIIIIGDGEWKDKLREMAKARGFKDKILFIGGMNNASRVIKAFDIFVQPSRYEGLSIALIETLISGVPGLASDVGGNRETFASEDELFELNNKADFMSKFKHLQYKEVLEQVALHNKEQAVKFHIKNTVDGYEDVYYN